MKKFRKWIIYIIPLIIGLGNWLAVKINVFSNETTSDRPVYQLFISFFISIITIYLTIYLYKKVKDKNIINKILIILGLIVNISYFIYFIYFLILILIIASGFLYM